MLTIERTKRLLNDQDITDEKAEQIRDDFYLLAEVIFEKWQKDREKTYQHSPTLIEDKNEL